MNASTHTHRHTSEQWTKYDGKETDYTLTYPYNVEPTEACRMCFTHISRIAIRNLKKKM